jgi:hypothetical protein
MGSHFDFSLGSLFQLGSPGEKCHVLISRTPKWVNSAPRYPGEFQDIYNYNSLGNTDLNPPRAQKNQYRGCRSESRIFDNFSGCAHLYCWPVNFSWGGVI